MIVYILLIGFATLLVTVEFVLETHSGQRTDVISQIQKGADGKGAADTSVADPLSRMRTKAMMMVGVILAVVVIVLTMFIKTITEPLQHMVRVSEAINGGDLSKTTGVRTKNELSQLSNAIDGMSTNLQEIIMLSRSVCGSSGRVVKIAKKMHADSRIKSDESMALNGQLIRLEAELATLGQFIELFKLYSVDDAP